ncbi:MAG: alpha/beta hydrolase [Acidobacteria bacterium]|nr:alpha/beta hydrolase [Acidobacteriota bacterium]
MTRRFALTAMAAKAQAILEKTPPKAEHRIPYGSDPLQFGDLRLPAGKGPYPLVINIHGGFWRAAYDLEHNGHLCEALRQKGVATWSIEYRRIGNPGGAWPGTFDDVKAAALHVKALAKQYPLNLKRTIAMGHSAGGHLALYLGAELPLIKGVISLAGVADLRRAYELKLSKEVVKDFLGGTPEQFPDRYKQASPIERLPLKKPTVLIQGEKDNIVPPEIARRYADAALKAGDKVKLDLLPGGHFELIDPASTQWATVERRVLEMLRIS